MRARAYAKINLGLAVGPPRRDGRHEIVTVLERIDLHDVIEVERADHGITVEGFTADTLVRRALEVFDEAAGSAGGWRVRLEKRIPVASGLGGGSSNAATALRLANEASGDPIDPAELHELASAIGSDVPFFLTPGAKLATGAGADLESVALPRGYVVVLAMPHGARKESTEAVYGSVDAAAATSAFPETRASFHEVLETTDEPRDLANLPPNQLAPPDAALVDAFTKLGAFRVDTSGAGPTIYGLFEDEKEARGAAEGLGDGARTWLARPVTGL